MQIIHLENLLQIKDKRLKELTTSMERIQAKSDSSQESFCTTWKCDEYYHNIKLQFSEICQILQCAVTLSKYDLIYILFPLLCLTILASKMYYIYICIKNNIQFNSLINLMLSL